MLSRFPAPPPTLSHFPSMLSSGIDSFTVGSILPTEMSMGLYRSLTGKRVFNEVDILQEIIHFLRVQRKTLTLPI